MRSKLTSGGEAEKEGAKALGAFALGALAVGGIALGAIAVGAVAVGAVAIGRLAVGRARIRRLEIDELSVRRLHIIEELRTPQTSAEERSLRKESEPTPPSVSTSPSGTDNFVVRAPQAPEVATNDSSDPV